MFIESFWNAKWIYYSRKTTRQSMKSVDWQVFWGGLLHNYRYFNLSLFFTHSCRFLKRCLQCTENMESLSSTTKNRWDDCSTAAKMLVECVEHYYAKRCEVVSWLFLSVKYKIKKENIKFIITQNVTNYLLIRKNCFLCFRLKVLWNSQHFLFHQ